ncbi:RICIN domain-containing protein [Streptomyces sp. NBC_01077]|uniref:RICIN domain-containing protein n=1 Tax=Streptomyces sp. NBC_01077 TaxID=2903746 RepID=UPI00386C1B06
MRRRPGRHGPSRARGGKGTGAPGHQRLEVAGFGTHDGAKVVQWPCHGGPDQRWYLERRADDTWRIRSFQSNKCLDAHNSALTAPGQGSPLQIWTCHEGTNQSWRLLSTGSPRMPRP